MRGGTVTMNFYDPDGHLLDYRRVEELAGAEGISLRTGCFCNPGAGETAEGLTEDDMRSAVASGPDITLPRFLQLMHDRGGKSAGAIRVSLGLVSNDRRRRSLPDLRRRLPESDDADHRRRILRRRIVPGHPGR